MPPPLDPRRVRLPTAVQRLPPQIRRADETLHPPGLSNGQGRETLQELQAMPGMYQGHAKVPDPPSHLQQRGRRVHQRARGRHEPKQRRHHDVRVEVETRSC